MTRILSAARFSDILRGSYLVSEQSPASSQLSHTGTLVSYINTPVCVKGVFHFFQRRPANFPGFSARFLWASCQGGIVQRRTVPAFAAGCFPVMPQGRGLPLPLSRSAVICLKRRRGGPMWPPAVFSDGFLSTLRVSPCGATSFACGGKGGKTPPGETHIAVGNRFPPAPVRSPPDPHLRRIPLRPSAKFPARKVRFRVLIPSGPLGPGAVQNFIRYGFTAAPGSDQPWQRVQVRGAPDGAVPMNRDGRVS